MNIHKAYIYDRYPLLHRENSPDYGISGPEEAVIRPLCFAELCRLLETKGTHLLWFGGPWCPNTAGVVDYINYYARKYGVEAVYSFDFRLDGKSRDASIREDITAQPGYRGPDKAENPVAGADYNYIYGELVRRYLTNLDDWVAYKLGSGREITYLDSRGRRMTVPKLQAPFLFLYNKDSVRPILYAFEKMYFRDPEDGKLYSDYFRHDQETLVSDLGRQLEEAVFCHLPPEGLKAVPPGEMITLDELKWLKEQKHTFLLVMGEITPAVQNYALAHGLELYRFDPRLDGGRAVECWGYPRSRALGEERAAVIRYTEGESEELTL